MLLIAAAGLALLVANSPLAPGYFAALRMPLGPLTAGHWIDDGLMALFFLLAGLEIKRELVDGHLANPADRRLPVAAALAGMAVPALLCLAIAGRCSASPTPACRLEMASRRGSSRRCRSGSRWRCSSASKRAPMRRCG